MCFHDGAGDPLRELDENHGKSGSIFASAASVLSTAAEEISLDDHLEKELANEVELWRMDTHNAAGLSTLEQSVRREEANQVAFEGSRSRSGPSLQSSSPSASRLAPPSTDGSGPGYATRTGGGAAAGLQATSAGQWAVAADAMSKDAAWPAWVAAADTAVEAAPASTGASPGIQEELDASSYPEVSSCSSSGESTFPGFIEDPIEKELEGEVQLLSGRKSDLNSPRVAPLYP